MPSYECLINHTAGFFNLELVEQHDEGRGAFSLLKSDGHEGTYMVQLGPYQRVGPLSGDEVRALFGVTFLPGEGCAAGNSPCPPTGSCCFRTRSGETGELISGQCFDADARWCEARRLQRSGETPGIDPSGQTLEVEHLGIFTQCACGANGGPANPEQGYKQCVGTACVAVPCNEVHAEVGVGAEPDVIQTIDPHVLDLEFGCGHYEMEIALEDDGIDFVPRMCRQASNGEHRRNEGALVVDDGGDQIFEIGWEA